MPLSIEKLLKNPDRLHALLAGRASQDWPDQELTAASVLLLLQPEPAGTQIWFIRRSRALRRHPGQIAFPGGKSEPEDADRWHTAMRESEEEIGLDSSRLLLLGQLDELGTPTGYRILPFVAWNRGNAPRPVPNSEVDLAFSLPLLELARVSEDASCQYPSPHGTIWGATGRILHLFLEISKQASAQPQGIRRNLSRTRSTS